MKNPKFLPAISVALYTRALDAAIRGQTCNVVMLCCASMEAFINEYTKLGMSLKNDDAKQRDLVKNKKISGLQGKISIVVNSFSNEEIDLISQLDKIEREDIFSKINTIKQYCIGEKWDENLITCRDYRTLVKIRNALVHPCSEMEDLGKFYIPKFLKPFYQQKKIEYFRDLNIGDSWVEAIDTKHFANWCLLAFQRMMISVLKDMYHIKCETPLNSQPLTSDYSFNQLELFDFPKELLSYFFNDN